MTRAVADDVMATARTGEAFRQLIEPHWRDLRTRSYRILDSAHDAEDARHETLLAAWRGLGLFRGPHRVPAADHLAKGTVAVLFSDILLK